MELLKKMGAPSNSGDGQSQGGGAGIIDALNDITSKMNKDFDQKIDDLLKKIEKLRLSCEGVDKEQ